MKLTVKHISLSALALLAAVGIAVAVAPPANSVIGNQATASYTDSTGASRTTNSNVVQTIVAQVNAFTLSTSQTKSVAPGGTVYFPHTITNTGNGADTYSLLVADSAASAANGVPSVLCTQGTPAAPQSASGGACNVFIYPDADGNGIPDSNVFLTGAALTPSVAGAGGTYKFVVAQQWPATITSQPTIPEALIVTATSQGGTNGSAAASPAAVTNTDTITLTTSAVINVTKTLSKSTGARSTAACVPTAGSYGAVGSLANGCENLLVTLTYTNTGAASSNLTITDLIGSGATAGLRYSAGSGVWSGCAAPLTDAAAGDCANMNYDFGVAANTVTAVVSNIAPGQSGTLTFIVNVAPTAVTGAAASTTTNVANYSYTTPTGSTPVTGTNPASYVVATTAGVVLSNNIVTSANLAPDNLISVASAPQGGSIWYRNVVWNTGTDIDSFDVTQVSSTFPAGTAITFYSDTGAGGVTGTSSPVGIGSPLTDSNGNVTPDTGPIAAGAFKIVWVRVDLQPNTTSDTALAVVIRATSKTDPSKSDDTTDELANIIEKTVDLSNGAVVGTGTQASTGSGFQGGAPSPAVATTNTGAVPGGKTRFNLIITPSTADTFDLSAWNAYGVVGSFTSAFGTGASAGYSVAFYAGACPAPAVAISAASITNTGVIAAATAQAVCAEVSLPASASPGTLDIYFRALSPSTASLAAPFASWDVKRDAFTVASTSVVTITPDRVGTTFPGGNVVYSHQVCNTGNSAAVVGLSQTTGNAAAGFTTALWLDVDNSGTINAGDTAIGQNGTITVAPNTCLSILDNTFAPAGGASGVSNSTVITASTGGTVTGGVMTGGTPVGSVTDTTQIVVSDISLQKEQREVTCAAGAGGAAGTPVAGVNAPYVAGNMAGKVNPGACIQYRITATNSGSAAVTGLVVSDTTPAFTSFFVGASCGATANTGTVTTPTVTPLPALGASSAAVGSSSVGVPPLGTVQLVFCVRVDS